MLASTDHQANVGVITPFIFEGITTKNLEDDTKGETPSLFVSARSS
jgi:hypothetical protein